MNISFLLEHMGATQISYYAIRAANNIAKHTEHAPHIFYNSIQHPCIQPLSPAMQIVEGWSQEGAMIATSLDTLVSMIDFPGPSIKIYYVNDIEWVRYPFVYNQLKKIIMNDEIDDIVCRSKTHLYSLNNLFNTNFSTINESLDYKELLCQIENLKTRLG